MRKVFYYLLFIGIFIYIGFGFRSLWFFFQGRTYEYEGEKASEQLQYWTVPEAVQLTSDIKGQEYQAGQGRTLWFIFTCDEVSFDTICSAIIAKRETIRSDSGVISISLRETGSAWYTIVGGRTSNTLYEYEWDPEWWPKLIELSGMRVVELIQQPVGSGEMYYRLYYSVERQRCWLSIEMG